MMKNCIFQNVYHDDDLVISVAYHYHISPYHHTTCFTNVLTGSNDLTGSMPAEICNLRPTLSTLGYDIGEVEGCA
jgi:hypothetical protein